MKENKMPTTVTAVLDFISDDGLRVPTPSPGHQPLFPPLAGGERRGLRGRGSELKTCQFNKRRRYSLGRRTFLKNSLTAASVVLVSTPIHARPPSDTIRTGIIGTGGRGQHLLKEILRQEGVKVVAACDIKPDRLSQAISLASRDNPVSVSDYRRLLDTKEVDAVFIVTPCDLHVEMAIAALQAGKHIYLEKPVGITPQSIAKLVKAARASKSVLQVGQQLRYDMQLREAIAKVHEGALGKILMVKAQRHSAGDLPHDASAADWFFNVKRSGDVIVEMAVHNLDICNWVMNSKPERAAGFGGVHFWINQPSGRNSMDGYSVTYEYPVGVKLDLSKVLFHPEGLPGAGQYFYIYGTEGALDLRNGRFYPMEKDAEPQVFSDAPRLSGEPQIAAFYDCIRNSQRPKVDIEIGATAALTAILGREAIYKKKVMSWKELGVAL